MKTPPDFYTGAPLDPEDLWFRDAVIGELWELLRTEHLVLSANDLHVVPLPVLTADEVKQFVRDMLEVRRVEFSAQVPAKVAAELGRPVPVFL